MDRLSPVALLRSAWRTVRAAWAPLAMTMLLFNLGMLVLVSPLIGWIFREALRANGMLALDFGALRLTGGIAVTLSLILVILLLAFWLAALQFTVLVLMLRRAGDGLPLTARGLWRDLGGTTRKLLRPSSFPLFLYLFLVLPLSGFGFASVLSQGIAVPSFISGELMKSPTSSAIWIGFMALLALLNLRFALGLPLFALTEATGGQAVRRSWRLTRGWAALRLALAGAAVLLAAALATLVLVGIAIVPTAIADAAAPGASPAVAAFSLGVAQLLGMALTALVTSMLGAILLALMRQREQLSENASAAAPHRRGDRRLALLLVAGSAAIALALGFFHLGTMRQLSQHPQTLVLGHRGFSDGGAENTIEGLEAAAAAGADLVEIDVMQTADRRFAVIHDSRLSRLAGRDEAVKDLTLEQLTGITVRDSHGHRGRIPSLADYVRRAAELGMPLLIEIKMGGLDTDDHVELLIEELERLGAMDSNIFHTLDADSVARLKQLRPDSTVGYILAFAGVDVPDTVADFVVIEQWSATSGMQQAAERAGLGFFSWTVNDEAGMRELLRRDVDGIITDHPDRAVSQRDEMRQETGLAGTLVDALTRFVVVF